MDYRQLDGAEARALPYAEGFFDVAVSVDSYHYYGTGGDYFPCVFSKLVKPGGQSGTVCPGLTREFEKGHPDTMKKVWQPEMFTFHSKEWWRHLWEKTGPAEITACYGMEDPEAVWRPWAVRAKENLQFNYVEFLEADTNNGIAVIVMAAEKF